MATVPHVTSCLGFRKFQADGFLLTRVYNHCLSVKAVSVTYSEFVFVALTIQHATRMRRTILSSVACPAVPYFPTLSHKRYEFKKNTLLNIICVFWFSQQILSETFLILRRSKPDMTKNVYCLHIKYCLFLPYFNKICIFSTYFRKNTQISNFMKIHPVGADLFHPDRHKRS